MIPVPSRTRKGGRASGMIALPTFRSPVERPPAARSRGRRRRKYRPETLRQKDAGDELALESGRTRGPPKVTGFAWRVAWRD